MVSIHDQDLDLPEIAVNGGQSAGMSRVVELLSGISLTRRVPLQYSAYIL